MGLLTGFYARSVKGAKLYFKRHRDPSGPQPPSTGGRAGTGRASVTDPEAKGTAITANDIWEEQVPAARRQGKPHCCGRAGPRALPGVGGRRSPRAPGTEPPGHLHNLWHLVVQAAEQQWDELGEERVAVPQVQQPAPHHARHRPSDLHARGAQWVCGAALAPMGTRHRSALARGQPLCPGPGPALGARLSRPHLKLEGVRATVSHRLRPAASNPGTASGTKLRGLCATSLVW